MIKEREYKTQRNHMKRRKIIEGRKQTEKGERTQKITPPKKGLGKTGDIARGILNKEEQ